MKKTLLSFFIILAMTATTFANPQNPGESDRQYEDRMVQAYMSGLIPVAESFVTEQLSRQMLQDSLQKNGVPGMSDQIRGLRERMDKAKTDPDRNQILTEMSTVARNLHRKVLELTSAARRAVSSDNTGAPGEASILDEMKGLQEELARPSSKRTISDQTVYRRLADLEKRLQQVRENATRIPGIRDEMNRLRAELELPSSKRTMSDTAALDGLGRLQRELEKIYGYNPDATTTTESYAEIMARRAREKTNKTLRMANPNIPVTIGTTQGGVEIWNYYQWIGSVLTQLEQNRSEKAEQVSRTSGQDQKAIEALVAAHNDLNRFRIEQNLPLDNTTLTANMRGPIVQLVNHAMAVAIYIADRTSDFFLDTDFKKSFAETLDLEVKFSKYKAPTYLQARNLLLQSVNQALVLMARTNLNNESARALIVAGLYQYSVDTLNIINKSEKRLAVANEYRLRQLRNALHADLDALIFHPDNSNYYRVLQKIETIEIELAIKVEAGSFWKIRMDNFNRLRAKLSADMKALFTGVSSKSSGSGESTAIKPIDNKPSSGFPSFGPSAGQCLELFK